MRFKQIMLTFIHNCSRSFEIHYITYHYTNVPLACKPQNNIFYKISKYSFNQGSYICIFIWRINYLKDPQFGELYR